MKNNKSLIAESFFKEGFSCSQAVLAAFAEEFGLDSRVALKLAQPFGGGIAHRGDICGAVTGAFLVIGLQFGRTEAQDIPARDRTYEAVSSFINKFEHTCGSVLCKELLGYDLSTESGYRKAEQEGLFENLCPKFVLTAVALLQELIDT
jgi:C_GCAxxG_C_C family probable redox protein